MPTAIERLQLFIEKAEELQNSKFLAEIRSGKLSAHFKWKVGGPIETNRIGPEEESAKAFILTLRFFRQATDTISLRQMEDMVISLSVDTKLKDEFVKIRDNLNKYLDSPPKISVVENGLKVMTRREIFETFLWGHYAHSSPDKSNKLKSWERFLLFDDLRMEFDAILLAFATTIGSLSDVCKRIIKCLK